jgi:hypothetical protein
MSTNGEKSSSETSKAWVPIVVAIISVVGALVGTVITVRRTPADLKLVDISVSDRPDSMTVGTVEHFNLATLNIHMKNDGDKSALVTAIDLEVKDVWPLELIEPKAEYLNASQTYSVEIDPGRPTPYSLTVPISQTLKGDQTDQIKLNIGLKPLKPFEIVFHVSCSLVYNGGAKTSAVDEVMVLPDLSAMDTPYFLADYNELSKYRSKATGKPLVTFGPKAAREVDGYNRQILLKAAAIGAKMNNRATALIEKAATPELRGPDKDH